MCSLALIGFRWVWTGALLFCSGAVLKAEEPLVDTASRLEKRQVLRTPVEDELLHLLERDFVDLLQQSDNVDKLLDAEDLLIATNDSSHWTNYSAATRILKADPDLAAIPLLLRYIVLHAKRSSCHVMIPEYRKTILMICGHELPPLYEAGPDLEARMRVRVLALYNDWWRKEKDQMSVEPAKMTAGQRQVLVANLLKEVRYHGDFTGSGGASDTAYGAYHNVYYKVRDGSSSAPIESPLHPSMIPLILAPSGYRADAEPAGAPKRFPYETIVILAEFVKNGDQAVIENIADDQGQNAAVRMACILALFRAGHSFRTDQMLELLDEETDLERRLILLLSLRWAGAEAVPALLKQMEDANIEIATAAGCALTDRKPEEAMPKFERLLLRHHVSMPLLLLNAMAEYKTRESRALLTRLLTDAVEGRQNRQHLSRIVRAFADGWEIPGSAYRTDDPADYVRQAKLALAHSREMVRQWQAESQRLGAAVASLRTRLEVAETIENLRRQEYKRLLALQGEEIVLPEESQEALVQLKTATDEVGALRAKLAERQSKLETVNRRIGKAESRQAP